MPTPADAKVIGAPVRSEFHEIRHGRVGRGFGNNQRQRHDTGQRQRLQILQRIVAGPFHEKRIDGDLGRLRHGQRVAVRRGIGDIASAERAAGAGPVLDDHRLAEIGLQLGANETGHNVAGAAGGEINDQMDRPARIIVGRGRQRRAGECDRQPNAGEYMRWDRAHSCP